MENIVGLAIMGVLIAWVLAVAAIWHWGPGLWRRAILCPEKKAPASVSFVRKEGAFGSLQVADVKECSLFPDAPVTCEKHCLG